MFTLKILLLLFYLGLVYEHFIQAFLIEVSLEL